MNPPAAIGNLFRFDFEVILSDSTQLGIFLELAETIAELEPQAREAAIKLALAGQEIPGWSLVRREGNRFVDSVYVEELLLECSAKQLPALLKVVAKIVGNVSEARWESLCNTVGRLDADEAVSHCGATAFLRKQEVTTTNEKVRIAICPNTKWAMMRCCQKAATTLPAWTQRSVRLKAATR
jgi:hypothetical protein